MTPQGEADASTTNAEPRGAAWPHQIQRRNVTLHDVIQEMLLRIPTAIKPANLQIHTATRQILVFLVLQRRPALFPKAEKEEEKNMTQELPLFCTPPNSPQSRQLRSIFSPVVADGAVEVVVVVAAAVAAAAEAAAPFVTDSSTAPSSPISLASDSVTNLTLRAGS